MLSTPKVGQTVWFDFTYSPERRDSRRNAKFATVQKVGRQYFYITFDNDPSHFVWKVNLADLYHAKADGQPPEFKIWLDFESFQAYKHRKALINDIEHLIRVSPAHLWNVSTETLIQFREELSDHVKKNTDRI